MDINTVKRKFNILSKWISYFIETVKKELTFYQDGQDHHVLDLLKLKENSNLDCSFSDHSNVNWKIVSLKCNLDLPYICENCLHEVLRNKFPSWTSGNKFIDNFIWEAQLSSSYEMYPEWIPYISFTQIEKIGEGGFGTVFSALWNLGIKLEKAVTMEKGSTNIIIIFELIHVWLL